MDNFEKLLDESLEQLDSGATLEELLARHPEQAARLKPLLEGAVQLERGRMLMPSAAYKKRSSAELRAYIQSHPHQPPTKNISIFMRVIVSLAVLVAVLLVTGTALAQSADPGDPLYTWKLTSEQAWRASSLDQVGVDLILANRRAGEVASMTGSAGSGDRAAVAMNGYHDVLARLKLERDANHGDRVLQTLQNHQLQFSAVGIKDSALNAYLIQLDHNRELSPTIPPGILKEPVATPLPTLTIP